MIGTHLCVGSRGTCPIQQEEITGIHAADRSSGRRYQRKSNRQKYKKVGQLILGGK